MFDTYRLAQAHQERLLRDAEPGPAGDNVWKEKLTLTLAAAIPAKVWQRLNGSIEKQASLEPMARLSQKTP